jgi:alpha-ketoglutarate-dependent 2,4-dichlorophenoxyacetate dioxygenase
MLLTFRQLHPIFAAEVSAVDLRDVNDRDALASIRDGMDEFAVLVFRNQSFSIQEQLDFARRFDGSLHTKTGLSAIAKNRFGTEAVSDISNVGSDGTILAQDDRRRAFGLGNRLWHTDASFQDPAGRYSMLYACVLPPVRADTQFVDMRAAYDALDSKMKERLEGLAAHHSIAYSRQILGFQLSEEEQEKLKGAVHPMVRVNPRTKRRSLYVASHANRVIGWQIAESRLFIWELAHQATLPHLVYSHEWRPGDFVIWDNLATMHRATDFEDAKHHRELRRVTTLDMPYELESADAAGAVV